MSEKAPVPTMRQTLCKDERLTRKKIIEHLYEDGVSIKTPALILIYQETPLPVDFPAQVMFAVSKKVYKRSHDRNRIKRLLREGYRKQKHIVYSSLRDHQKQAALLFIFTGRQLPNAAYVHGKISELFQRFTKEIAKTKNDETNPS